MRFHVISIFESINLTFPDHVVERLLFWQSLTSCLGQVGHAVNTYTMIPLTLAVTPVGESSCFSRNTFSMVHDVYCWLVVHLISFQSHAASTSTINYFSNVTFQWFETLYACALICKQFYLLRISRNTQRSKITLVLFCVFFCRWKPSGCKYKCQVNLNERSM